MTPDGREIYFARRIEPEGGTTLTIPVHFTNATDFVTCISNGFRFTANGLTIGDVSGHGVDSGLLMMMAQTSILSILNDRNNCTPSDVLSSVNSVIRENISRMGSDHYMAMTAIRFNETQMKIAGKHQDIIIYRAASNKTETISTQGTWLGIADDIKKYLTDTSTTLDTGDIVLLFTDGITEAANIKNEMYGQKRLEECLNHNADLPVGKLIKKIIKDVISFQEQQLDDITLLAIKKISQP